MDKNDKITVTNGIKLVGETIIVPGSSLLIDGKIKTGLMHTGVGVLASVLLGGTGVLAVAANSLSLSITGKSLLKNLLEPTDNRDINIKDKVHSDVKEGLNLEEIQAGLLEDVEDLYLESQQQQQKKTEAKKPHVAKPSK